MSKAVDQMVIDHPDRLHVCIDDRRTHEGKATVLQIVAHGVGLGAARGDIAFGSPAVLDRATVDEAPLVRVEAAELDRKSTRLNSSHSQISYAVFCLKKKNSPR